MKHWIFVILVVVLIATSTSSMLPTASAIDIVELESWQITPRSPIAPKTSMCINITVKVNSGQLLESRGDMLRNTDGNTFGHWPHINVKGTINAGESYTFNCFGTMVSPITPGTYQTAWRVWRNNAWVGPTIVVTFDVATGGNTGGGSQYTTPPAYTNNTPCASTARSGIHFVGAKPEHFVVLTIPKGDVLTSPVYTTLPNLNKYTQEIGVEPVAQWTVQKQADNMPPLGEREWRVLVPGRVVSYGVRPINNYGRYLDIWENHPEKMVYLRCKNKVTPTSAHQYLAIHTGQSIVAPQSGTQRAYQIQVPDWMRWLQTSVRKGSNATITLIAPDGTVYAPTNSAVDYHDTASLAVHTLNLESPQGGLWTVVVDIIQADPDSVFMLDVYGKQYHNPEEDNIPPVTGMHLDGTKGRNAWFTSDVLVTLSAQDNPDGRGVQGIEWSLDNGSTWHSYHTPFTLSQEGMHTIRARSYDAAGNYEQSPIEKLAFIDTTPPITSILLSGTLGNNGWYTSTVSVVFTATDTVSGIDATAVSVNGGAFVPTTTLTLHQDGIHTIQFATMDVAGNTEATQTIIVKIDTTPPVVHVWADQSTYTRLEPYVVHYTATDPEPGSGISDVEATFNEQPVTNNQTIDLRWLNLGTYHLKVMAQDNAGWKTTNAIGVELVATLESLDATIAWFCADAYITKAGICTSLHKKVAAATAARDRGQRTAAYNILAGFQHEITAQTGKAIKAEATSILIMDSTYIMQSLR